MPDYSKRLERYQLILNSYHRSLRLWCLLVVLVGICCEPCSAQRRPRSQRRLLPPVNKILPVQPLPLPIPPPAFSPLSPSMAPNPLAAPGLPVDENTLSELLQGDFRFEVTENFLQRLLSRKQQNQGAVQDFILGAQVNGQQTTVSSVSIDCLPSRNGARFNFEIQGTVQTATTASTPRATIVQQGNNQFRATKPVLFDGSKLLTRKATLLVMPDQKVLGAHSRHSRMPLLGPLADQIALGAAVAHTPQSNLIAGQKLIRKLQPLIDTQTDQNLTLVNKELQEKVWTRLEQINLMPLSRAALSTGKKLIFDYRFSKQPVRQNSPISNDGDVRLSIHEQLIAGLAAKQELAGKRVSLNKIVDYSNIILQMVDPSFIDNPNTLPVEVHFTCSDTSPLKVSFQNNQIEMLFRGKFQLQNLPLTEMHRVRITFSTELNEKQLIIKSEVIDVREELSDGSLAEPGFTQRAFVTQFESLLRPVHIEREKSIPLNLNESEISSVAVKLNQLNLNTGWLGLSWSVTREVDEPFSPTPALPELPVEPSPAEQIPLKFPEQIINP